VAAWAKQKKIGQRRFALTLRYGRGVVDVEHPAIRVFEVARGASPNSTFILEMTLPKDL